MAYILHIETSTIQCSVALSHKGKPINSRVLNSKSFSHNEKLHHFISEVLEEANLKPKQLDAISVSKGPGSYTGLRIGVAAAKGFCFALEIPLIALNSLEILVQGVTQAEVEFIIPMIDARRMEVYTAIFDGSKNWINQTSALVLNQNSFKEIVKDKTVLFLGNGTNKFQELIPEINLTYSFENNYPNAIDMVELTWEKYILEDFESLAYFEPFYLKDFQTTTPKQK
tara:strand:+ start:1151 stop:1831 length:681 start_codon:yes stop_codon:yes gene_type:complete